MATGPPVEVTLRSCDGQDSFAQRCFTLGPSSIMPIGRASKSPAKPDLIMAESNAFIDSPVVSREHAVLSADHQLVTPHICITDKASMHGTYLNGNRLDPNQATKLRNGDLLQFGVDVSRNDSFYTARKYLFESTLPNNFPRAFSVPDVDSSEDEDVDVDDIDDIMTSSAPRYGSQTNPVNVDDFEDAPPVASPVVIQLELVEEHSHNEEDVTLERVEPSSAVEQTAEAISSTPAQAPVSSSPEPEDVEEASQGSEKPTPATFASQHHLSSDDGMDQSDYSSDDNAGSLDESAQSQDGMDSDSDAEHSDSESDVADASNEEDEEDNEAEAEAEAEIEMESERAALPRGGMVMLNCEQGNGIVHESPFAPRPSAPIGLPHLMDSPAASTARRDEPYALFSTSAQANPSTTLRDPEQAAPHIPTYMHPLGMFDDFPGHVFGQMSPLPPRPTAPRPGPWGTIPFANPYPPPVPTHLRMYPEEMQPNSMFLPHAELVPEMFDRYPGGSASDGSHRDQPPQPPQPTGPVEQPWTSRKPSSDTEMPSSTAPAASEAQTPPPALPSEPSSPPQPRRTKVSIPEIVDSPQQPPTPTSVSGSLKRKADVLDDDASEAVSDNLQLDAPELDNKALVAAATTATTAPQAPHALNSERPIKKLRSRLQSAAKYTLGAAFAVALMSQIPDAFFEP